MTSIQTVRNTLSAARQAINDFHACTPSDTHSRKASGGHLLDARQELIDLVIAPRFVRECELRQALLSELYQWVDVYLASLPVAGAA